MKCIIIINNVINSTSRFKIVDIIFIIIIIIKFCKIKFIIPSTIEIFKIYSDSNLYSLLPMIL